MTRFYETDPVRSVWRRACQFTINISRGQRRVAVLLVPHPSGVFPTFQTVVRHALVSEGYALVEDSTLARAGEDIESNLFVVAGIIDFVEFVAGAEFRADRVPNELEKLDAFRGGGGCATIIFFEERCQIGILKIFIAGGRHEQAAPQKLFKDVANGRPALRAEKTHGVSVFLLRHDRPARGALRIEAHRRRHSP